MLRAVTALLLLAGGGSLMMGAYHLFLPSIFGWDQYLGRLPDTVRWGALSINAFLSTLLVALGVLTLSLVVTGDRGPTALGLLAAAAVFWVVNLGYQVFIPMPLPEAFGAVRWVLLAFAAAAAALNIAALRVALP